MKHTLLFLLIAICVSCQKTENKIIVVQQPAATSPVTKTIPAHFNDTLYFDQAQNINYRLAPSNDTGVINIFLSSKGGKVGTELNVYCYIKFGTKINILSAGSGTVFKVAHAQNENSLTWYYHIVYDGNFGGDNIFRVGEYTFN